MDEVDKNIQWLKERGIKKSHIWVTEEVYEDLLMKLNVKEVKEYRGYAIKRLPKPAY